MRGRTGNWTRLLLVPLASGLVAACMAQTTPATSAGVTPGGVASASGTAVVSEAASKYVLRAGDRVNYRVAEDPVKGNAPLVVAVNSVGEANFPVSRQGDVRVTLQVRGKTLGEVREELRKRLVADYYHKATVELALAEKLLTPGRVQFFGEMRGSIPILPDSPPLLLSEAVLQLGASDFANLRRVRVHRVDPATQQSTETVVDVQSILKDGKRDRDMVLQDGDRVEVPQKWIN